MIKRHLGPIMLCVAAAYLSMSISRMAAEIFGRPGLEYFLLSSLIGLFCGMWGISIHDRARLMVQLAQEMFHRADAEAALSTELYNQSPASALEEQFVEFNAQEIPPREYLMRRSYNPNDAQFPGAVVREWACPVCETPVGYAMTTHQPGSCPRHKVELKPYSVDVPLIKPQGHSWR